MRKVTLSVALLSGIGLLVVGCHNGEDQSTHDSGRSMDVPAIAGASPAIARAVSDQPIQPIPLSGSLDSNKVTLGERLFHETRLSKDDSVSCSHCHNLATAGVDNLPRSIGISGKKGSINSPTVFNATLNIAQFWDGRASNLLDQIDGPIHNPNEMGTNWEQVISKLSSDSDYRKDFKKIYSDGITSANIKDAIATFEQSLLVVDSPFDKFLMGDASAISDAAKQGYVIFKEYGCIACHQGSNVGGNLYQPFGIVGDYFADRGVEPTREDMGRFNVTGKSEDMYVFKVPSLRLSTLTAPYFHDGSAETLDEAIRVMIKYQLGRSSTSEEEHLIHEFLRSLVGEYKGVSLSP